jgi:hypothetical protein
VSRNKGGSGADGMLFKAVSEIAKVSSECASAKGKSSGRLASGWRRLASDTLAKQK